MDLLKSYDCFSDNLLVMQIKGAMVSCLRIIMRHRFQWPQVGLKCEPLVPLKTWLEVKVSQQKLEAYGFDNDRFELLNDNLNFRKQRRKIGFVILELLWDQSRNSTRLNTGSTFVQYLLKLFFFFIENVQTYWKTMFMAWKIFWDDLQ